MKVNLILVLHVNVYLVSSQANNTLFRFLIRESTKIWNWDKKYTLDTTNPSLKHIFKYYLVEHIPLDILLQTEKKRVMKKSSIADHKKMSLLNIQPFDIKVNK